LVAVTVAVEVAVDVDIAVRVAIAVAIACDVLVIPAVGLVAILLVGVTVGVAVSGRGVDAAGLGVLVAVLVGAGSRVDVAVRMGVEVAVKLFAGLVVAVAVLTICSPVNGLPAPAVTTGVQFPPPALLSQIWKRPMDERSLALFVVGVKVHVAGLMLGELLPETRDPRVTVSVLLPLLQAYVATQRAFASSVPPVILPTATGSFVEQLPLAVLPTHTVVLLLHTLLPFVGPVVESIAWLKVKMIWSPVSSLAVFALLY
jgi:hypothetical protein